jgi:hypothetical protein
LTERLEVQVEGSQSIDDLLELRRFLNDERELRGAAKVEQRPPSEGSLGAISEIVSIALSPGGAAAILAPTLIAWIKQRRSKISLRIKREDGTEIALEADRIKAAGTEELRRLASEVSKALDGDQA